MRTFDYIIVGGGSAGCVLANRLSEDPNTRVCLLEAGPRDRSPFIRIPLGIIAMMWSRKHNWRYHTEPEAALQGRKLFWPRGKTLGGSSAINAMCYTRGHAADYDQWAELGNRGWSYREVLPYFRKLENYEPFDESNGDAEYHGRGGPLNVAELRHRNRLSEAFVDAAFVAGHRKNKDFNGAEQEGFGFYKVYQKDGRRCSNAEAFLRPAEQRPNLTVITGAHATRVLLENQRAVGVEYRRGRKTLQLRAEREVLLAGGAINSPQLLMLSGIGPREELARHGIELKHELPGVGENLQDHLDISVVQRNRTAHSFSGRPGFVMRGAWFLLQYLFGRRGPIASNVAECGGFCKTSPEQPLPDLQMHFCPLVEEDHGLTVGNTLRLYGYTVRICDLRPLSRGRIGLNSADPLAPARIEANYLDHPRDLDNLVAGVRRAREIIAAEPLAAHSGAEMLPGAAAQSDEQLRDYVRAKAETIYHPVGTCKMGSDSMAVVDSELRVHGVRGLRVVDASIMPTLVGGNTNAPTTMIAEKAADLIRAEARANATAREETAMMPEPAMA